VGGRFWKGKKKNNSLFFGLCVIGESVCVVLLV